MVLAADTVDRKKNRITYKLIISKELVNLTDKNRSLYCNGVRFYPDGRQKLMIPSKEKDIYRSVLFRFK